MSTWTRLRALSFRGTVITEPEGVEEARAQETREEFFKRAHEDFAAVIRAAKARECASDSESTSRDFEDTLNLVRVMLGTEGDGAVVVNAQQEHLVRAVHQWVLDNEITVESREDAQLLLFAFGSRVFEQDVDLLRYFVSTGEIMEVLRFSRERFYQVLAHGRPNIGIVNHQPPVRSPYVAAKEVLERIYAFDTKHAEELRDQGDDENSVLQLPLEIRMGFAGVCEDKEEKERAA